MSADARHPQLDGARAWFARGALPCAVSGVVCILLTSAPALADLKLQTQAPARVEVGQRFSVQFTALADSGDEAPSQPKLSVPPNFAVQGPSISTQRQVNMTLGHIENRTGISASWVLQSNSLGKFRLGPASVISNGHQVMDKAFIVEIVPAGSIQGRRPRMGGRGLPFDPFDPFGDFDPFSSPLLPPMRQLGPLGQVLPDQQEINGWPHELDIAAPRDPVAFLDARAVPKKVIIGQQLSWAVFAYGRPAPFDLGNPSQPSLKDFLSYDLMDGDTGREQPMRIGADIWYARKIQERALFPLRSGKLVIEPMRVRFRPAGPGSANAYDNLERESQSLTVTVVEPPLNGRPAGYHLGDVGQYQLSGSVEPREVTAHEAVSVSLELAGLGNLPQQLELPEIKGVEWLEPTTSATLERKGTKLGGKRNWQYVVRLHEPGTIELGTIKLPYWDPEHARYEVASVELGSVHVKKGQDEPPPTPNASSESDRSALGELRLTARERLGDVPPAPSYYADTRHFWQWLLLGPIGVVASFALTGLVRALRQRLSRERDSAKRQAQQQLELCKDLTKNGDAPAAASALERALVIAIETATGLRARGIIRSQLADNLAGAGVPQEQAQAIVDVLQICDSVRFTGAEPTELSGAITKAQPLIEQLTRREAGRSRAS